MNYKKVIGYGALIWAIVYLVATVFVAYKMTGTLLSQVVVLLVLAAAVFFASQKSNFVSRSDALKYALGWIIVGFILDLILTIPFTGWQFYLSWEMLLGYLLGLVVPQFTVKPR